MIRRRSSPISRGTPPLRLRIGLGRTHGGEAAGAEVRMGGGRGGRAADTGTVEGDVVIDPDEKHEGEV